MLDMVRLAQQLDEFETTMERFYRQDPVEASNALSTRAVESFNAWAKTTHASLEAERMALERQLEPVRQIEAQMADKGQQLEHEKPEAQNHAAVEAYNRLVAAYNTLVRQHKELVQAYDQCKTAYDERVNAYNRELALQREKVEEASRQATDLFNAYNRWMTERGAERLCHELNGCYASLHTAAKLPGASSGILQQYIERLRKMRWELGMYAKRQQEQAENGVLIVQAMLCGSEECFMLVDTGASVVSITPECVEVLGLSDQVGDEVEMTLAAGIRIKAPQLLLPSMSIQAQAAEHIKAVVLPESHPGIDGCVGLSFLNRFMFRIEKERPQKLVLQLLDTSRAPAPFDVFISHKSEDLDYAKSVFDFLTASGYHPFLSEVSLQSRGETDFQKTIDAALESATHLVVVGSSRENIQAPWVEAEWRLFVGLKRAGRKRGNVIGILCGGMTVDDLPVALQYYQAISMGSPHWQTALRNYLPVR
jgi:clan AA aspartic protease (TIGR02281 family)